MPSLKLVWAKNTKLRNHLRIIHCFYENKVLAAMIFIDSQAQRAPCKNMARLIIKQGRGKAMFSSRENLLLRIDNTIPFALWRDLKAH